MENRQILNLNEKEILDNAVDAFNELKRLKTEAE